MSLCWIWIIDHSLYERLQVPSIYERHVFEGFLCRLLVFCSVTINIQKKFPSPKQWKTRDSLTLIGSGFLLLGISLHLLPSILGEGRTKIRRQSLGKHSEIRNLFTHVLYWLSLARLSSVQITKLLSSLHTLEHYHGTYQSVFNYQSAINKKANGFKCCFRLCSRC